jgi:hypothetical protein
MTKRLALFFVLLAGAPALAETAPPAPAEAGRFSMSPTEGGFLRLDRETGAVSFCSVSQGLSQCRVSADERSALEVEIERLRRENAELKTRLGEAPRPPAAGPSEEEFERALSFTERFMRRMLRLFREEGPPGTRS